MLVLVRSVLADLYAPCVQCLEKMSCMCSWAHRSSQYKRPKVCKSKPENSYSSHMPVSTNASYIIIHVCRAESCLWPSASLPRTILSLARQVRQILPRAKFTNPFTAHARKGCITLHWTFPAKTILQPAKHSGSVIARDQNL